MTKKRYAFLWTLALALVFVAGRSSAQSFNYVSVDVPCAGCPGGIALLTSVQGINPGGDLVGFYKDAVGVQHGFLLRGGQFANVDVPGALAGVNGVLSTAARGISPSGDIVGSYVAPVSSAPPGSPAYCPGNGSPACIKGFLYHHHDFSTVLVPGHPGAIPQRITSDGDIYGCLHDFDLMGSMYGFVQTRFGYISLTTGGGELAGAGGVAASMNNGATPDGNTIVGLWTDMTKNHTHGYLVRQGVFQSYDVPDSTATSIWDINPGRDFVGSYHDSSGTHGFLQPAQDSGPIPINYPEATATNAYGINPGGTIVGQYTDPHGKTHGFLAIPAE